MSSIRMAAALQALNPLPADGTDGELLQRYMARRDGAAFAELMRRHGPMVYGTCRRISGNGADADDAFQATFFVLARNAGHIRTAHAVGSWLHGVAVKVARKAQQQAIRRRMRQMAAAKPEAVHPTTPVADWWAVIDDELNRLPDPLRQAILTCDIGGKSRSQAALELGWPEGTVAKRLAKARQELAKRLTQRGVTLGVAAALGTAAAAVPNRLLAETIERATAFAVGDGAGSLAVRTLAEGVMRSMKVNVLKLWAIVGLMTIALTGGGIMLAGDPDEPATKKPDGPKPVVAKTERVMWKEKTVLATAGWLPGSVAYSSDGKTMIAGGTGGKVVAFDTANDTARINFHWTAEVGGNYAAVAFSADGKSVLATFKDGVKFLDAKTGKAGITIEEPETIPIAIGVFPDREIESGDQKLISRKVIFGNALGYSVKEWIEQAAPGTIHVSTVAKEKQPVDPNAVPLAVDPAGRSAIITGPIMRDTGKNVLWAYVAGDHEKDSPGNRLLVGHEAIVVSAAWSKDGKTAVTGDADGRVIVWDAKTMKETRRIELGTRIAALAITADGKRTAAVVIGKKAEYYVWETANPTNNMKPIHVDPYDYSGADRACLAFSPDGRQLTGSAISMGWLFQLGQLVGRLHVWEIDSPKAAEPPQPVKLKWEKENPIADPQFDLRSVEVSPDGKKFAVRTGAKTFVYETATGRKLYAVNGRFARFIGGDLFTWVNSVVQYDAETGKEKKTFPPAKSINVLFAAQVSPDGKTIAGFDGIVVRKIDIATGDDSVKFVGQGNFIRNYVNTFPTSEVVWSPDGKRVAGVYVYNETGFNGGLGIWDAETGKLLTHLDKANKLSSRSMSYAFSPDGKALAVAGLARDERNASSLTLLDSATFKVIRSVVIDSRDGGADATAVAYSPDGRTIATAVNLHSGKGPLVRVQLWDADTGEIADTLLPEHDTPVISSLAFTPDGKTLIAATGSMIDVPQSKEILHRILIWRGEAVK
jgi:RNA polymerase sigma factor (sigma-70 family)